MLPTGSKGQSFLWELVMSFFLMFVIMAGATDTRAVGEAAAIAIGEPSVSMRWSAADFGRLDEPGPLGRARARQR